MPKRTESGEPANVLGSLNGVVGKLPKMDRESQKRLRSLSMKEFMEETGRLETVRLAKLRDMERTAPSGIIDDFCV